MKKKNNEQTYLKTKKIMTYLEKQQFLSSIQHHVQSEPELLQDIIRYATIGMTDAIKEANERAIDLETVAMAYSSMVENKRYKKDTDLWAKRIIKSKFTKHKKHLGFKWDELKENND